MQWSLVRNTSSWRQRNSAEDSPLFRVKRFWRLIKEFQKIFCKKCPRLQSKKHKNETTPFFFSFPVCVTLCKSNALSLSLSLTVPMTHAVRRMRECGGDWSRDCLKDLTRFVLYFNQVFSATKTLLKLVTLRPFRRTVLFDQKQSFIELYLGHFSLKQSPQSLSILGNTSRYSRKQKDGLKQAGPTKLEITTLFTNYKSAERKLHSSQSRSRFESRLCDGSLNDKTYDRQVGMNIGVWL